MPTSGPKKTNPDVAGSSITMVIGERVCNATRQGDDTEWWGFRAKRNEPSVPIPKVEDTHQKMQRHN